MHRIYLGFAASSLTLPVLLLPLGGVGFALNVAAVSVLGNVLLGIPLFYFFREKGWLHWWQILIAAGIAGAACSLPLSVIGLGAIWPYLAIAGCLSGMLFWFVAVHRNGCLTR
jgi:hypothetical protein